MALTARIEQQKSTLADSIKNINKEQGEIQEAISKNENQEFRSILLDELSNKTEIFFDADDSEELEDQDA